MPRGWCQFVLNIASAISKGLIVNMRLLETIPEPPTKPDSKPESEHCYPIKVITALVGGGARSKQLDPVSMVRPQSVRGHLRFWWRLTVKSVKDMRTAEAAIFGNTKQQSALKIRVEVLEAGRSQAISSLGYRLAYATFPFRQGDTKIQNGIKFKLHLNFGKLEKPQRDEVITALKCWVNFGGIGSRTRRGFGALECDDLIFKNLDNLDELVKKHFYDHKLMPKGNTNAAWQYAIQRLQMFRQVFDENEKSRNYVDNNPQAPPSVYVGIGRKTKSNSKSPSYSYWPEAPLVRRIVNQLRPLPHCFHDDGHHPVMDRAVLLQLTSAEDDRAKKGASAEEDDSAKKGAFPRALFGLPIEFWMKCQQWDRATVAHQMPHKDLNERGHSIKPKLVPAMGGKPLDRFASPLILRPIKIGGQYHALALVLKHDKHPDGVILQNGDNKIKFAWQSVSDTQSLRYDTSPLKVGEEQNPDALNALNALNAFLAYFNDGLTATTVRCQMQLQGNGCLKFLYPNGMKKVPSVCLQDKSTVLLQQWKETIRQGDWIGVQLTLLGEEVIKIEPITPKATTP